MLRSVPLPLEKHGSEETTIFYSDGRLRRRYRKAVASDGQELMMLMELTGIWLVDVLSGIVAEELESGS